MSDVMRIQPFATQLRRILAELERNGSIFDIHRSLFWTPSPRGRFAVHNLFGKFRDGFQYIAGRQTFTIDAGQRRPRNDPGSAQLVDGKNDDARGDQEDGNSLQ